MIHRPVFPFFAASLLAFAFPAGAAASSALEGLPVRDVTIFKDGHAWVRHEGEVVLDGQGRSTFDELPAAVLGTFWAGGGGEGVELVSATSGKRETRSEPMPAGSLPELLAANAGKRVRIVERPQSDATVPKTWDGELVAGPEESRGSYILLKHAEGTVAIPVGNIASADFATDFEDELTVKEEKGVLTLLFDVPNGVLPNTTPASVSYLQRSLRWIPNYRITLGEGGIAQIELQATIVNDLADLSGVSADLVIGVPSFEFADQPDPMSLQEQLVRVDAARGRQNMDFYLSNSAIMAQSSFGGHMVAESAGTPPSEGPIVGEGEQNEDLYVFNVENLTLKKGERIVVPVTTFEIPAEIVYKLTIPYGPPVEARATWNSRNHEEFEKHRIRPVAKSVVRLENESTIPITTAPALIFNDGRILAQSMTRYTPIGGDLDIEMTEAVDIRVRKQDVEVDRVPNDFTWRNEKMTRIDMEGEVTITNYKNLPVMIDVRREVLGRVGEADNGGEAIQLGGDWDDDFESYGARPYWWNWYSWPWWWYVNNGTGFFRWEALNLGAGESVTLTYDWRYHWAN